MRKRNPRSEAAIKEAVKMLSEGRVHCINGGYAENKKLKNYELQFYLDGDKVSSPPIAIIDLRDFYRKRAPLKGITKAVRKAVSARGRRR